MKIEINVPDFKIEGLLPLVIVRFNQKEIPYPADRTLTQLIEDLAGVQPGPRIEGQPGTTPRRDPLPLPTETNREVYASVIQRRDLVTCLEDVPGQDGNPQELFKGKVYTVLDIHKQNGQITAFDIIDTEGDSPRRIPVFPSMIALKEKAGPPAEKIQKFSIVRKCEKCKQDIALEKETGSDLYAGICEVCHEYNSWYPLEPVNGAHV